MGIEIKQIGRNLNIQFTNKTCFYPGGKKKITSHQLLHWPLDQVNQVMTMTLRLSESHRRFFSFLLPTQLILCTDLNVIDTLARCITAVLKPSDDLSPSNSQYGQSLCRSSSGRLFSPSLTLSPSAFPELGARQGCPLLFHKHASSMFMGALIYLVPSAWNNPL